MERNGRFQDILKKDEIAVLVGCYDALTAKIVQKAGFDAAYLSGAGVSNTKLGLADTGLLTQTEIVDRIRYVSEAVDIPFMSDADTGYGSPLHVRRTVRLYDRAGASALHIEDQKFPKKCGHFENKELIAEEKMVQKIKAGVDAKEESFTLVARTDARAVEGVEAAIERANSYVEAGADMIFPEAPQDEGEMERFCSEIDAPVMANMVEYGKTPLMKVEELEDLGFDLVIFPNSIMRAAMKTMVEVADHIKSEGTTEDILDKIASFELRNRLTDKDRVDELESKYASD